MGKKLAGNGLFESSRILLPEHREQFVYRQKESHLRKRPQLDDQLLDQLSLLLMESSKRNVKLLLINLIHGEMRLYKDGS